MTWLVWRQHRNQAYIAAAALAAFAVLLLVTGRQMASQYQSALTACTASHTCGNLANTLILGTPVVSLLVTLTVVVPCLLGVFWGGPLVAREFETGTSQFAWMQSITRRRWLTVKVGWILLAAAVWGGAVSALVTWWSSPVNALSSRTSSPASSTSRASSPSATQLFAVALGIAAGTLLRRHPARDGHHHRRLHLPAPGDRPGPPLALHDRDSPGPPASCTTRALGRCPTGVLLARLAGPRRPGRPGGERPDSGGPGITVDGVSPISQTCRPRARHSPSRARSSFFPCLAAHGYRGSFITYQPASRYWAFQGIETGIFVLLAAALIAVTAIVVLRRDA